MKLIIYLLKKIIPLFFGAVLFFSLVLNLVDLFLNISKYLQNACAVKDIFTVMMYYVPKTMWYAVPVAILFSTSYTLSDMYATNELEALFASGVSLLHFTFPALILSFAMSFGLFYFEDKIVVRTYEQKTALQDKLLKNQKNENNTNIIVISENGKIIYRAGNYIESSHELNNSYFVFRDENKKLDTIFYSREAHWSPENERWVLYDPKQYVYKDGKLQFKNGIEPQYLERLTESYEIFRKNNIDIQSVNTEEARVYINHLKKAGLSYQEQLAEYYKKYSFPFIVFLVVFLSIGLTGKTKKNVLLISLASCISACVLFYVMMMVTMILAKNGTISPFMGAWFPIIFFTIASIILLKYSRT